MLSNLEAAIVQKPLLARADATVLSAVEQISNLNTKEIDGNNTSSTCVVIVSDGLKVLGILTQKDVMRLVTQQQPIAQLTLKQFWQQRSTSASLIISQSDLRNLRDINTAIAHFESSQITHLAIVDAQDHLVGLLQHESLKRLRDSIIHQESVSLLVSQQKIHERIAKAEPLKDVLGDLLLSMETHLLGSRCSITLCQDGRLSDVIAPSLPQEYAVAVEKAKFPIAEGVGSCGTAAFRRELVVVSDIANDPLWQDYKNFALAYGLQACSSIPIFASDRTLLGAFGIYYHEQKAPQAQELDWIAQAANIAGIAIERDRAVQALQQLNYELENRVQARTQELQEREQFLQTVLDTFPLSVFWKDINSVYLGCNQNFLDDAGLPIEQIIGKTDREMPWGETEADLYRANDQAVIETQTAKLGIVETQQQANGQSIWVETNKLPLRNLQGEVIGVLGTYQDISDRKNAELERERQLAILDSTSDLIGTCDPDGTILYLNQAWRSLLQQHEGELANRIQINAQHPVWALELIQNTGIPAAIQHGAWLEETAILDGWGQEIPVSQMIIAHKSNSGELKYLSTIIRDISSQKHTEEKLSLKQSHLAALINNIPHIAWIKDEQSRFIAVNEPFSQACSVAAEELVDKTDFDIWSADLAQAYRDDDAEVLQSGQRKVVVERVARADGTLGWFETTKTPFKDDQLNIAGTVGIAADITDLKTLELSLKASERRYASLAAAAPVAIFRFDEPLNCVYVNERWSEMSGRPMESALGHGWMESLHPDDSEQNLAEWTEYYANSNPQSWVIHGSEGRQLRPDGSTVWSYIQVAKEFDEDGNVVGYIGTLTDITDRKNIELALQESQAQFRRMTESVPGMIYRYVLHPDGRDEFIYISPQVEQIYELTSEAVRQDISCLWAKVHRDDVPMVQRAVERSADSMQPFFVEVRLRLSEDRMKWIQISSQPDRQQNGDVIWDGVVIDISDRKNTELVLQDLSDRLEFALNGANIGIWEWQMSNGRLLWDERMFNLYGIPPEEFSGKHADWFNCVHPDDRDGVQQDEQQAVFRGEKEGRVEFRIIRPDGTIRFIDSYAFNQYNAQGEIQKTIGLNIDITDRKQAEAQLQRINEELIKATRLKDEFLANMSHELRTPLNAILGMTEILQEEIFGDLNNQQLKSLETIEKSSNHLLELINDILDVAKIEAGQIKLSYQPCNVEYLCQSSLVFIKQQAFSKNIQLKSEILTNLPLLNIDERRIRQVLINLLSNAVKFTPDGGKISLQVNYITFLDNDEIGHGGACETLEISVIDTGIGIAPDQIKRLFQPFVQVESALNRNYDGSGLGLALVKRLVELHGGEVRLTSELGVGSCFTITLPISPFCESSIVPEPPLASNAEAIAPTIAQAPLILLAEDNEANITMFVDYLSLKGYRLVIAHDGRKAINLAQQTNPDVILMDIQMPEIDGLEAIQRIRQIPELVDTPIIALTAMAMSGDRDRCIAMGANDYLSKPVSMKNLVKKINAYLTEP
jgi:PAS domain S-box-containing protein